MPFDLHEAGFEFVVGDRAVKVCSVIAEFISAKVCQMRRSDATCGRCVIETADPSGRFQDFVSLGLGESVTVEPADFGFFVSVASELENDEVLSSLVGEWANNGEITVGNAIERLRAKGRMSDSVSVEREIAFIASHLFEFAESDVKGLGFDVLWSVLSHGSLTIESEDWLCGLILELAEGDVSYAGLLDLVLFEFMSADAIRAFVEKCEGFIVELMSVCLWRALGRRLSTAAAADRGAVGARYQRRGPARSAAVGAGCGGFGARGGGFAAGAGGLGGGAGEATGGGFGAASSGSWAGGQ